MNPKKPTNWTLVIALLLLAIALFAFAYYEYDSTAGAGQRLAQTAEYQRLH